MSKRKTLLKKLQELDEMQNNSYRVLIKAVTEPPVLALPKPEFPYSIDTDAFKH